MSKASNSPNPPGFGASTVTKRELISRIAEKTDQTKVAVKETLQCFLDEIISELAAGNRLEFREFGVFEVRVRAARVAQNPRTLEKVMVPAKRVVKFKVGRSMRAAICDQPVPPELAATLGEDEEGESVQPQEQPPPPPPQDPPNSPF